MFIDFRERKEGERRGKRGEGESKRERERERNIDVREKHPSVASHRHPDRESNPQPRYVS